MNLYHFVIHFFRVTILLTIFTKIIFQLNIFTTFLSQLDKRASFSYDSKSSVKKGVSHMPLKVEDILQYPSLKQAKLITGSMGMDHHVTGAMVMEALDIEEWGRPGLILLTSYFALKNASPEKIELFFQHAKEIGIAGFILKMDRLVNMIPDEFIALCQKYSIPLIKIDKQTSYEKIINDILESIINRNAYILQHYYNIHQHFTHLMLSQPDLSLILEKLKTLIQSPVTLIENVEKKVIGTDESYNYFKIIQKEQLPQQQYMNFQYQQYAVLYPKLDFSEESQTLSIQVPNLGYEEYELVIHLLGNTLRDIDYVAVENAIIALQTELIKQYALRQNKQSRLNEMASDLLHGRFSNSEDVKETILDLNLDPEQNYRVILFHFENKDPELSSTLVNRFTDTLINHSRIEFPGLLYVTRKEKVFLIIPASENSLAESKGKAQMIIRKILQNSLYKRFKVYTSISNEVNLFNLPEGYRQAFDTQKIIQMIGEPQVVATYQDMGIYQIFVETGNLNSLERFIPEKIWDLKNNNPELLETLHTFIDVNQNYSETAQILFVHPKTVKYRIERLKESYDIDFHNPEEILQYSIAIRILKIIPAPSTL